MCAFYYREDGTLTPEQLFSYLTVDGIVPNSDDIMKEIRRVGEDIVSSVGDLSFITEGLGQLVQEGLDSVNSSIQANNLLTGIQTYQMYKINRNTKI